MKRQINKTRGHWEDKIMHKKSKQHKRNIKHQFGNPPHHLKKELYFKNNFLYSK